MSEWQRHFWRNAATNYLRTGLRLATGLILFRLTFQQLGTEAFGFYSLLWSLFGYTILLDFGLGFTAQKAVAEHSATGRTDELNRLVATIFWTFAFFGGVLLLAFAVMQPWFLVWTKVSPGNVPSFRAAYTVFTVAMALAFPLGIFPEMLRGLQRIDLANWLSIGGTLLNLGLLGWGLLAGWPLPWIVFISVATTVAPSAAALWLVHRRIPGLSLHPRHFHGGAIRGVLSFSLVAYLITFTNLIMSRTDQAVISLTLGVGLIALYQAGYKVAEMFGLFSTQMQDALTPAAAQLNIRRDAAGLRELLVRSTRLTIVVVSPLYGLCAVYLEPLVRLLTGLEAVDAQTWWVGQILLFATYSSLVTNSCAKRILMMCGWERKLLAVSLVDATANLALSLALVWSLGVPGVAAGTMIPTVLVGWLWMLPLTAHFAGTDLGRWLAEIFRPILPSLLAGGAALGLLAWLAPFPAGGGFLDCAWRGLLVVGAAGGAGFRVLRGMRHA
ncbi:MAG: oligosaccharide flippase family protein [Opitutaceae bacterium]|nr:oligosaccharide flippase family protein [Opitutaceae bacterium]